MTGQGSLKDNLGPVAPAVIGATALPATNGNEFGLILAYSAITIGVCAIVGQIVVRIVRRHYQLRMK